MTSAFKLNLTPGSDESISWINSMNNAANHEVFDSKLVLLVDYKWE